MAFSMTNVLNSIVEATTRTPHAVRLSEADDLYVHRPVPRPTMQDMMINQPARPVSAAEAGRSGQQLEHDTLSRIRDALYHDQQA